MKIILNKYGESLELKYALDNLENALTSWKQRFVIIGDHSCGEQIRLVLVSGDWVALTCVGCNFRKLVPRNVCSSNLTFVKFFADIVEKTKDSVPRRTFVKMKF